nr:MAG TPA_asm: hypothetical protein [Caudoviricetes sp.]
METKIADSTAMEPAGYEKTSISIWQCWRTW